MREMRVAPIDADAIVARCRAAASGRTALFIWRADEHMRASGH